MHGKDGIKKVGEVNAVRLSYQAEARAVASETPGARRGIHLIGGGFFAKDKAVASAAVFALVEQLNRVATVPLHVYNRHRLIRQNTLDLMARLEIFQVRHRSFPERRLLAESVKRDGIERINSRRTTRLVLFQGHYSAY